jgi:hypothetical protein
VVVFWGDRHLSGKSPHASRELTRHGDGDEVRLVAACHQWSGAFAAPDLGLPPEVLDPLGWLFASPWQRSAHLGGRALGPGPFDQSPSSLGVPGCGNRALMASRTGGICCRDPPQALHPVAGGSKPGQGAHVGHPGDGHRAWHPTESLPGFDHRVQPPGVPVRLACLFETLEAFGVFGHRTDLCLDHEVLRRCRTADCREPPEVSMSRRSCANSGPESKEPT